MAGFENNEQIMGHDISYNVGRDGAGKQMANIVLVAICGLFNNPMMQYI